MQGGRWFLLKFSSELGVNMDHWATFLDLHLHHGWKKCKCGSKGTGLALKGEIVSM
jgi:hypothetical protein